MEVGKGGQKLAKMDKGHKMELRRIWTETNKNTNLTNYHGTNTDRVIFIG